MRGKNEVEGVDCMKKPFVVKLHIEDTFTPYETGDGLWRGIEYILENGAEIKDLRLTIECREKE